MKLAADATFAQGRYRLQRRLGAGGMASVWLALDERLGRHVAVKVIADTLADDERWLTRFKREARAAAALSHPGIVQVFDYGIEDGRPYLVMEYISGANLAERLADAAAPVPEAPRLARELLEALAHVHAAGIVHRDIKPANVLLDGDDRAHLTDFGIAQADGATSLTQTGMLVGTMKYLAPEVSAGGEATARSDLYSSGMVLREVAGHAPAPALAPLIEALTAPQPEQRPGSAAAALQLLDSPLPADADATPTTKAADATAATRPSAPDATLVQPAQGAGPEHEALRAAARRPSQTLAVPRRLALIAALALVGVILAVALFNGGRSDDTSSGRAAPAPAQPGAPLDQQLDALQRIVDHAARR